MDYFHCRADPDLGENAVASDHIRGSVSPPEIGDYPDGIVQVQKTVRSELRASSGNTILTVGILTAMGDSWKVAG